MGFWSGITGFDQKRPERIAVEIKLSCGEDEVLTQEMFYIYAYVKGNSQHVGRARIGVNARGSKPEFHLANLDVLGEKNQGHGISSQIMDRFEALIRKHKGTGSVGDSIKSDSKAAGMYEKRGWRKSKDGKSLIFP